MKLKNVTNSETNTKCEKTIHSLKFVHLVSQSVLTGLGLCLFTTQMKPECSLSISKHHILNDTAENSLGTTGSKKSKEVIKEEPETSQCEQDTGQV